MVKNKNEPLPGAVRIINSDNGMIGMPEFTDFGVKVRILFDNKTKIGDEIKVESEFYPATNGRYVIYKLDFDIANRGQNFYYVVEARRKEAFVNG